MTNKEYLQQYITAEKRICAKLAEIDRIRSLTEKVTQTLGGERVQTSVSNNQENALVLLADMETEVKEDIKALHGIKRVVQNAIEKVEDDKLRNLLHYRYICGMTFEQIAVNMDKSWRWTVSLHGRALGRIEKNIK